MKKILFLFAILFMLFSCNKPTATVKVVSRIDGRELKSENYIGNGVVKKITIVEGITDNRNLSPTETRVRFMVFVDDFDYNKILFVTNELVFNIGDTVHIDTKQKICYPYTSNYSSTSNMLNFYTSRIYHHYPLLN